ncbi:MAG: hypothetical protein LBK18_00110 [Prevotellaceae bacterium]|nr:hypothetical protein [Prevotellaceae bacterium]
MNIRELHNKSMELAGLADLRKMEGNKVEAMSLYEQSYSLEYDVAMNAYKEQVGEPSVSVLLRSAASLAISCKKLREAEKLIALALSGEPPFEIAEELRNLLENVNFHRHLEVKGAELSDDEVQLVIAGRGIGYGYAKTDEIMNRIDCFKDLTVRTIERIAGKSFRKNGPVSPECKINPYMTSLQAASMAFRIKFSNPQEFILPGFGSYGSIIEDITDNISLINENKINILKDKIKDTSYFNNFIALTKELAPDGDIVNLFGITSIRSGQERKTLLTERKEKLSEVIRISQSDEDASGRTIDKGSNQTITGILKIADATTNTVKITIDGTAIALKVPDGLSDIVKKYWDEKVTVKYYQKNKKDKLLVDIEEYKE